MHHIDNLVAQKVGVWNLPHGLKLGLCYNNPMDVILGCACMVSGNQGVENLGGAAALQVEAAADARTRQAGRSLAARSRRPVLTAGHAAHTPNCRAPAATYSSGSGAGQVAREEVGVVKVGSRFDCPMDVVVGRGRVVCADCRVDDHGGAAGEDVDAAADGGTLRTGFSWAPWECSPPAPPGEPPSHPAL